MKCVNRLQNCQIERKEILNEGLDVANDLELFLIFPTSRYF